LIRIGRSGSRRRLLPEIDSTVHDLETRLEELEQEDTISMRRAAP
jgi:hypothetical protein